MGAMEKVRAPAAGCYEGYSFCLACQAPKPLIAHHCRCGCSHRVFNARLQTLVGLTKSRVKLTPELAVSKPMIQEVRVI